MIEWSNVVTATKYTYESHSVHVREKRGSPDFLGKIKSVSYTPRRRRKRQETETEKKDSNKNQKYITLWLSIDVFSVECNIYKNNMLFLKTRTINYDKNSLSPLNEWIERRKTKLITLIYIYNI